jgi:hypothetical protein
VDFRTETFLGKVAARKEEYCDAKWVDRCDGTGLDPTLDPTDIVHTESEEEMLTHFMNTIPTGDAKKIRLDLKILSHARFDTEMRTDVPLPAPICGSRQLRNLSSVWKVSSRMRMTELNR